EPRWEELLDVNSDEMYREGNHLPPRAMLRAVKNQTPTNIRNYKLWQERKLNQLNVFQSKLLNLSTTQKVEKRPLPLKIDFNSYYVKKKINESIKLKIFYSASCPNCHRMHSEIYKLMQAGVKVELVSTDEKPILLKGVKIRMKLFKNELTKFGVTGTPHLVLLNSKTKKYYNLIGYQSFNNIMKVATEAVN
ncbi:MAG: thioredoxin family protein, partial [Flavobacteriales bacterium]|nr:thioredoxin family protein [Flavobacteriales bacterium]